MRSTSKMSHLFSQVPKAQIPRSQFNRSHGYKTTFNADYLVPFYVDEVLPGDTFNVRATLFARLASPLTVPIMDNMFVDTFFFFVPNRLVWSNWKKFNGEQTNPGDSTSFLVPTVTGPNLGAGGIPVGHLFDYMGLPTGIGSVTFDNLHGRAYNLIYNEWFRDENLQNSVQIDTGDGPDTFSNYNLLKRGKRHDYFTSALPWPQKGTAVSIPLGTQAIIKSNNGPDGQGRNTAVFNYLGIAGNQTGIQGTGGAAPDPASLSTSSGGGAAVLTWPKGTDTYYNYADLSSATAATINQLRQAFQIQKLYERDARGGTRYTEIVRSHFGVISPDARLQRPEFLGGTSRPVQTSPVAQTSASNTQPTPQGNLSAYGTFHAPAHGFVKSFTEHGVLIGLINIRCDLNYQQGLNRMWSRQTRFDFYWPALSHLGEQAILNQEIYCQGSANPTQDAAVFGYQERYAEYRYKPSQITGQFRSTYSTPLDSYHLAEKFTSLPALNSTFITPSSPMSRVKAVTSAPDFLLDAYFDVKCARPMPVYAVPGLIDHF